MKNTSIKLLILSAVGLLCGCHLYSEKPHDDIPGVIFPSYIERYEQMGYRFVPAVILSPARLEYVGTNQ